LWRTAPVSPVRMGTASLDSVAEPGYRYRSALITCITCSG
jgi:hypothetical protein